jgi:hypothetical protein
LKDYLGNNITSDRNLTWNITFTHNGAVYSNATYVTGYVMFGVYKVEYNITEVGQYKMFVEINQTAIRGSPFSLNVAAGSSALLCSFAEIFFVVFFFFFKLGATFAGNCIASGSGTKRAVSNELETFTIVAFDQYNNPRLVGGDVFDITIEDDVSDSKGVVSRYS